MKSKPGDPAPPKIESLKLQLRQLRMELEEAHIKSSRNDLLFNLTLDFMVVKNASNHYFTQVNPAFVRALGYSEKELTGQPSTNFIHPEDQTETRLMAKSVAENGSNQNFENRYLTRDGRVIWLSWTAVYNPKDNLVYAVAKDITQIKERELQIAQQRLEIAAASKLNALGQLAAGIAHEINNPLTIVYGQACRLRKMIIEGSLNQENLLQISEKIEQMSARIVTIIDGMRAFSRDGSNDPLEFASIKRIIEDTLVFCWGNFKSRGINVLVDEVPAELQVYARPVQISQVLLNLLNNAYDIVSEAHDKWVRITVEVTEFSLELRVIDSGAGIAPPMRSQIFEAFFTTKPVGKGTGLGLNIAQTILASHGGEIFLDESASHTTFVIRLPRVS